MPKPKAQLHRVTVTVKIDPPIQRSATVATAVHSWDLALAPETVGAFVAWLDSVLRETGRQD
jgi:hypothetical protein